MTLQQRGSSLALLILVLTGCPAGTIVPAGEDPSTWPDEPPPSAPTSTPTPTPTSPGECSPPSGPIPYADRTENAEFLDPPGCASCPGPFAEVEELDAPLGPGATTLTVSGSAAGATRCEWYVQGGACGITHGAAGTDPDGGGRFSTTFPVFCGANLVRLVCRNAAGARVLVRQVAGTECAGQGRDLRLTLSWDSQGYDMELHLIRPGGIINSPADDCTWFSCYSIVWGPDPANQPHKDVDNTGYFGPENIYLDRAPDGLYHVLVEHWGSGGPSTNTVDVTIREKTVARLVRPGLDVHAVWKVGTVRFPEGVFTPIDTVIDCYLGWGGHGSEGCGLSLP